MRRIRVKITETFTHEALAEIPDDVDEDEAVSDGIASGDIELPEDNKQADYSCDFVVLGDAEED